MGLRIEKEEFINKTFRLNTKLVEEVEQTCAWEEISMNKFVAIALRYALDNLED
jgi:predicted HicB family RNase H-like nuclease